MTLRDTSGNENLGSPSGLVGHTLACPTHAGQTKVYPTTPISIGDATGRADHDE